MATYNYIIKTETLNPEARTIEADSLDQAKEKIGIIIQSIHSLNPSDFDFTTVEEDGVETITAERRAQVGDKGADFKVNIETLSGIQSFDLPVGTVEEAKARAETIITTVLDLKMEDFEFEVDEAAQILTALKKVAVGDKGADFKINIETLSGIQSFDLPVGTVEEAKNRAETIITTVLDLKMEDFEFEVNEDTNVITALKKVAVGDKGADFKINIETLSGIQSFDLPVGTVEEAKTRAETIITTVLDLKMEDFDFEVNEDTNVITALKKVAVGDKGLK